MTAECAAVNLLPESWANTRFAALGDSVTLGLGDPMPHGGWRGWAALLAGSLGPPDQVEVRNFAQSGALISDVAEDQLPRALSLAPTVASVLVGMNDTLRGTFDLAAITADLEKIVVTLQRAGVLVLTASLPDPGLLLRIPASLRRPLARRARAINSVLGQLAVRYDVVHVDLAANPALYDKRMWGVDRLHPSERGHRLLARLFAAGLTERGMPPLTLPDPEPANPEPSAWAQARWMATKGTGWLVRRSRDLVPSLLLLAWSECWQEFKLGRSHRCTLGGIGEIAELPLRLAGRVIVLDPDNRVLLLRYDNDPPDGQHWATPGGGLNPGESYAAAAARELTEETGWDDLVLRGEVHRHVRTIRAGARPFRQHERLFLARTGQARRELGDVAAMHAADGIAAWRWWTLAELDATAEVIWPAGLGGLIRAALSR